LKIYLSTSLQKKLQTVLLVLNAPSFHFVFYCFVFNILINWDILAFLHHHKIALTATTFEKLQKAPLLYG